MQLPNGWTEITGDRHREFKGQWTVDDLTFDIEVGSLDPNDDACLEAIKGAEESIAKHGGKLVV